MGYVALFGCLGTAHASKNKKLFRVVRDEITALVDSPQDVEKPLQVSPTTVILSRKRGDEAVTGLIRSYSLEGVTIGQN